MIVHIEDHAKIDQWKHVPLKRNKKDLYMPQNGRLVDKSVEMLDMNIRK